MPQASKKPVEAEGDSVVEQDSALLNRFEQKAIDDLAISILDPDLKAEAIEHQAASVAKVLRCSPVQAAIAGAKQAASVARITPRFEGFFGAGDLFFDLDAARETMRYTRSCQANSRPARWGEDLGSRKFFNKAALPEGNA